MHKHLHRSSVVRDAWWSDLECFPHSARGLHVQHFRTLDSMASTFYFQLWAGEQMKAVQGHSSSSVVETIANN